jgi:hypothetical protein
VNQRLPASVYLPFVNSTIRNYTVLHIVIDEAKVFQTKERAPLLLCIEAFRPEAELEILLNGKKGKKANNDPAREERLDSQGYALVDHDPQYDNYRSNSWHSSLVGGGDTQALKRPLLDNPY